MSYWNTGTPNYSRLYETFRGENHSDETVSARQRFPTRRIRFPCVCKRVDNGASVVDESTFLGGGGRGSCGNRCNPILKCLKISLVVIILLLLCLSDANNTTTHSLRERRRRVIDTDENMTRTVSYPIVCQTDGVRQRRCWCWPGELRLLIDTDSISKINNNDDENGSVKFFFTSLLFLSGRFFFFFSKSIFISRPVIITINNTK